ncbi:hypothetical protein [Actinomadura sp. NEAU-AAG7]|uniref:hypothetical protein n=1 Tax=Actinomadura sp. NEAU-AAG7 TaxID=2839640 RepID=UPI001BE4DAC5|nr:hypothetical protein [Actinomadura sp. NEAU-AAG7]MBT2213686.1 hypothetical protein [Actinomadura sp. NEAU-AAG7]
MSVNRVVPQPDDAGGPAEFLVLLRRLQEWSGLRVSEVEERVWAAGVLVPGGMAGLLGGDVLPSREVVVAFVTACGLVPEDRERWAQAHARISSASAPGANPDTMPIPIGGLQAQPPAAEGDELLVGRPASNMAPPPGATRPTGARHGRHTGREASAKPEQAAARPRHRKTGGRGGRPGKGAGPGGSGGSKRPLSLLVAAPAFITIAVVGSTLLGAFGGESRHERSGEASGAADRIPPPRPGWYSIMPVTGGEPDGQCLSILPDDHLDPQLARDRCAPDDRYQRVEVAEVQGSDLLQLRAWTTQGHLRCVTLDTVDERAALHMRGCGVDRLQRFRLDPAKRQVKAGQLYRLVPEVTRANGMCVGIDLGATGGAYAIHSACGRTDVDGFLFTPAAAPPSAD